MSDKTVDNIKGRTKEAAGAITDDEDLKDDGQDDQRAADAKDTVDSAADAVKDGIDNIRDRLSN